MMNKMAVRSLTDVFTFMRNNAIKNRTCLHDQVIGNDSRELVRLSILNMNVL